MAVRWAFKDRQYVENLHYERERLEKVVNVVEKVGIL
jgi:hypothetical protein